MKIFADVQDDEIENSYKNISQNVKQIRIKIGLSQTEVALSMGFTTATFYTNAENSNNKHFNLEHLIKLSKLFNIDICEFFKVPVSRLE